MSDITPYVFEGFRIRTLIEDGEPWWVASDVAQALGYRDAHNMTRRIDDEDIRTRSVSTNRGDRQTSVINEPGLYTAILGSQIEGAQRFKRWVTRDVLPEIRRTGSYNAAPAFPVPQTYAEALQLAANQALELEAKDHQIAELTPAAETMRHIEADGTTFPAREAAQLLTEQHGIKIGRDRLIARWREWGWCSIRGTLPTQRVIEQGLMVTRLSVWEDPVSGTRRETPQGRLTAKGLIETRKRLLAEPPRLELVG